MAEIEPGPSWARQLAFIGHGRFDPAALDPTQMAVDQGCGKGRGQADGEADAVAAANDSIRAMMLVRTYRVRGHLAANLDPLGLSKQDIPPI
jgi:2-oxoglutarate dehydrogenase E1 component